MSIASQIKNIIETEVPTSKVLISGSMLLGTDFPNSDIDLIIIFQQDTVVDFFYSDLFQIINARLRPEKFEKDEDFIVHILKVEKAGHKYDLIGCFLDEEVSTLDFNDIQSTTPQFKDAKSIKAFKALKTKDTLKAAGVDMGILAPSVKFLKIWAAGNFFTLYTMQCIEL